MMKYNILIVEDHTLTRFAIKTILEEADFVETVFEAQSAKEAFVDLPLMVTFPSGLSHTYSEPCLSNL